MDGLKYDGDEKGFPMSSKPAMFDKESAAKYEELSEEQLDRVLDDLKEHRRVKKILERPPSHRKPN